MSTEIAIRALRVEDPNDELESLRDEVRTLRRALSLAESETARAKQQETRALANLRRQLSPLYRALQDVFGELENVQEPASAENRGQWDEWKARLGPGCAKVIDALLLGGEMTIKGIMLTAKMGPDSAYKSAAKMEKAGILVRHGGRCSLKSQ